MSEIVVVRSIVSLVWYPEVKSITADALDAVIESVIDGETTPPPVELDDHARPMDWVEQMKLLFEAAEFVKVCIDIYNISPTYEEARKRVTEASTKVSAAIRSQTAKVTSMIENWTKGAGA